jgi:amino acid transporter
VAIFVCGLAVMATTARLLFSYGRDGQIPASGFFKKVSPRFKTPIRATLFVLAFTAILLIQQSQLYRIIAWATVGIYIPYQMVVFASMRARTRGWPKIRSDFSLGGWGWIVNIIGFVYGVFMIINMSWPRTPDAAWYDNYLVPLSVIIALGIGLIFYLYHRSKGESMEIRGPEEPAGEAD